MHRITYINENLKNGCLIRWPGECFPMPVYIAPCNWYSMSSSDRYSYANMVIDAFNTWEKVCGGKISFYLVNTLAESQMNVEWRRVDRKSLGNCQFNFDNESRLYSAEISIGISDGIIHRKYMDENEVYHTILHEIGHSLGLGHSKNPEDIMYTPHQYGLVKLSQRDINSINWLYSLPYGASAKSLNEIYSTHYGNIDDIVAHVASGGAESKFQKTLNSIKIKNRNLEEEQDKLAQMKKFQMSIQNIKLPKEIADRFKDM
ncbi:MAG: matrixin family metalloprotease [Candidatus Gastranaerophilales bacterium]|nr:matrixin family metalloprotease [Candidatus Gastranaerophilales bacterium]